jgi:Na+-translocating ferredoxin:NAD+ oxidoreductase RNF subunit RnfB
MELEEALKKLPGLDCGDCGFTGCEEMAGQIALGKRDYGDCVVLSAGRKVEIRITGAEVPLGSFVQGFVAKTVLGMVSSLKKAEIKPGDVVEIRIRVDEDDLR